MELPPKITTEYFALLFWNHWKEQILINEDKALYKIAELTADAMKNYWNKKEISDEIYKSLKKYIGK